MGTGIEQRPVLAAPPCAGRRIGEVGEHRPPGPYDAPHHPSVRQGAEPTLSLALVVHAVATLLLHTGVDDHREANPLGLQFGREPGHVTEVLFVDGEVPILVHVLDVELDGVQREVVALEVA